MKSAALRWVLGALLCTGGVACSKDPTKLTQIVVVVDSELHVPDELDGLSIAVEGVVNMPEASVSLSAAQGLPRSLGLVHAGGPLGPVRVTVRGQHAGETVVERTAQVAFKTDQTLKLALALTRVCADAKLQCDSGETCIDGACAPDSIANLPVFDGKTTAAAGSGARGGGGKGGAPSAGGTGGSGASGAGGAADGGGGAGGSNPSNQPPSCSVDSPDDGAQYYEGDTISLSGSCSDPESGSLTMVRWRSNRDGQLGVTSKLAVSNLSVGDHTLSLCAADPADSTLIGCSSDLHVSVQTLPALTVSISALTQPGATNGKFSTDAIDATAAGSGVDPLTYSWTDSVLGDLGSGDHVTLGAPVPPGKHTLVLRVTDGRDRTATATQTFSVLPTGKDALYEAYGVVNSALIGPSKVSALAASGGTVHVATGMGVVYGFDATATPSTSAPSIEVMATDNVRDISLHAPSGSAYLSTSNGLRACPFSSNAIGNSCTSYTGSPLPSNDVKSALRLTAGGTEVLLVGTMTGLLIAQPSDITTNARTRTDVLMTHALVGNIYVWLATSTGLASYELAKPISSKPRTYSDSPTNLTALSLGTSGLWVGSGSGLARYDISGGNWTTWNKDTEALAGKLASNDVRAVIVTRPTIAGTARDVIWIGTNAGVSRYDTNIHAFDKLTTDDGLPSNSVRAMVKLDSGELVVGTDMGLAIYRGM